VCPVLTDELTDAQAELLAKLILWVADCPIKLESDTVWSILASIKIQKIRQRLRDISVEKVK